MKLSSHFILMLKLGFVALCIGLNIYRIDHRIGIIDILSITTIPIAAYFVGSIIRVAKQKRAH